MTRSNVEVPYPYNDSPATLAELQAWQQVVNAKLSVSVTDFGAVGDGITDDTLAIQDAIDWAKVNGGATIYFPAGTYVVEAPAGCHSDSGLNWALNISGSNIRLVGDGEKSVIYSRSTEHTGLRMFEIRGAWKLGEADDIQTNRLSKLSTYDMDDAALGDQTITLTSSGDASHFAVGDWVYIRCGQLTAIANNNEPNAEINKVRSISGADIGLCYPLAKDYADDGINDFGIANAQDYVIENVGIEDIAFDVQNGYEQVVNAIDGIVGFTFRPARSVVSGQLMGGREIRNSVFNIDVHFNGDLSATSYKFHWPFTLATGCTDSVIERCVATTEYDVVQFHVHEGAARWKAENVILLNPPDETANNNPVVSIIDSYDGTMVAPTVINGGHTAAACIYVQEPYSTGGYGRIIAPTVLGQFGSTNPITLAAKNWAVRDPKVPAGKRVLLNRAASGNKAPQTPIIQQELTAFVDYTDTDVILGTIPADSYIRAVRVQVLVSFNAGGSNTLDIGKASDPDYFVSALAIGSTGIKSPSLLTPGWKNTENEVHAAPAFTGASPSQGRAIVTIEYSRSVSQ